MSTGRDEQKVGSTDIHASPFVFGAEMIFFESTFPQVDEIEVRVRELSKGIDEGGGERLYDKSNYPGDVTACSNPLCRQGGFPITSIVKAMVRKKKTEQQGTVQCAGEEVSSRKTKKTGTCGTVFEYSITISYRSS